MAGTAKRVVMPQLGESVHEGTISKWLVKPGDKVTEFEPMLEVDTDKVSAEVPAPVTGILKEILAKEGQTVQAGAEIAVVEVGGDGEVQETSSPTGAPSPEAREVGPGAAGEAKPTIAAEPKTAPKKASTKTATPEAPVPAPTDGTVEKPEPTTASEPEAKPEPQGPQAAPARAEEREQTPTLQTGEHRYSPAVQMVASELKVDLSRVEGTGIGGRVTKKDVQDFATSAKVAPAAKPAAAPAAAPGEGDQVVQLTAASSPRT